MYRVILFIVVLMGLPLRAQEAMPAADTAALLLETLALVPDNENSRFILYYGDFEAALAARGLMRLSSTEIMQGGSDLARLVGVALPRYFSFLQTFNFGTNMVDVVGFDLLDIARGVEFGRSPQQGLALLGAFEGDAVAAAHQARGYAAVAEGTVSVWCLEGDCTRGIDSDFSRREIANIFGGDLGRSQPVGIIGDRGVFSSPIEAIFNDMVAAADGNIPTLADAPEFQALAHALSSLGVVRQLLSSDPTLLYAPDFPGRRTPDPRPVGTLPQYGAFAMADIVVPEGEIAVVALVYADAEMAAEAVTVLEQRLATFPAPSESVEATFVRAGAQRVETTVYADELTGLHVVMVLIYAPPPTNRATTQQPEGGSFQAPEPSGRFYERLHRDFVFFLDLPWLRQ